MLLYSSAFRRMERYGPLTYLDAIQSIKPFPNSIYHDHMPSSHINIITGLTDNLEEAAVSFHLCVGSGVKVRLLSMYHLVASAFTIGQSGHSSSSYLLLPPLPPPLILHHKCHKWCFCCCVVIRLNQNVNELSVVIFYVTFLLVCYFPFSVLLALID